MTKVLHGFDENNYAYYYAAKQSLQAGQFIKGVLTRKLLEEWEFQFIYLCSLLSNKQKGSKLQSFLHLIFSKKYFLWKPYMTNIVCKKWFLL